MAYKNKVSELIKKVDKINSQKTLAEIDNEIKQLENNLEFFGANNPSIDNDLQKLDKLYQARQLALDEGELLEAKKAKHFIDSVLINDFINLLNNNISYYNNKFDIKTVLDYAKISYNQNGYIKALMKTYGVVPKILEFKEYQYAFNKAYKIVYNTYLQDVKFYTEKQKAKIKRQKDRQTNLLYVLGLGILLDKRIKLKSKRW